MADDTPTTSPAAPTETPDEVLTVDELARWLKVPRSTLYEVIARGDGPPVQGVGRHLRASRAAVLAWLAGGSPRSRSRRRKSA